MVIFKGMLIKTNENHAKRFGLALDSGSKLGCDVPTTNPPIHLWRERQQMNNVTWLNHKEQEGRKQKMLNDLCLCPARSGPGAIS